MSQTKILVVDDEERMRSLIRDFLLRERYGVIEAADGEEALEKFFDTKDIKLILLDIMMPKLDGWQVLAEIRRYSKVPVIMLTALGDDRDEIKGFEMDVDEYVTKPFSPRVLMARIAAILRRQEELNTTPLVLGDLKLDRIARELTIGGKVVELSLKEYGLMQYFLENPGVALSRESILNHVWNYNYYGDARTIDTHVKKLRSKLGDYGEKIKTVWGVGYKLEAEARDHA
ncbi:MAG: response regulator transcription factor [Lachnospiraceae bacterium]|nr:response regulator transcription factor [Lachnospiraceae bacterium]